MGRMGQKCHAAIRNTPWVPQVGPEGHYLCGGQHTALPFATGPPALWKGTAYFVDDRTSAGGATD
jgi:hypothetical protein